MAPKKITLAFDIYGTLVDTNSIEATLQTIVKSNAVAVSRLWREKQLEYSFRRGLMKNYANFTLCTRQALDYACLVFKVELSDYEKQTLMDAYHFLPVFPEVKTALVSLKKSGFTLYAFSNGQREMVCDVLKMAGIENSFTDIISVDEINSYKPNPVVYQHLLDRTSSTRSRCWLVSSNPFDIIGAISFGMKAAWLQRSNEMVFDPWEIAPTVVVNHLFEISRKLIQYKPGLE